MDKSLFERASRDTIQLKSGSSSPVSFHRDALKRLFSNKLAIASLIFLALLSFCAIVIPMFTSAPYYETHLSQKNLPPSSEFYFGTDDLGRSLFSRVWYGARLSLFIGIVAALIDMFIGVVYGAIAGYVGGKVDDVMMRIADIFYSLPRLVIVILLMVVMGQGVLTIIIAMTITGWISMARIIRSQVLTLKQQEFVLAARAMGASHFRCLLYHLIPNTFGSIITTVALTIPAAIFTEAFLSFLGLGIAPPAASWGTMASDGLPAFRFYPWRLFFPATFISLTLLAFNLLGDRMRDAFDPRLRR